ncbi:44244_t:CDS:2 [Gigaspora margarita]|uniref:44244_t:CDS:1 n=1 Tax=Gigaspora margarita TaxID=4874 RepID=A0ABN7UG38_GIGMA|nr:44244_t:CDS:2 [Gigaspora margarita]
MKIFFSTKSKSTQLFIYYVGDELSGTKIALFVSLDLTININF